MGSTWYFRGTTATTSRNVATMAETVAGESDIKSDTYQYIYLLTRRALSTFNAIHSLIKRVRVLLGCFLGGRGWSKYRSGLGFHWLFYRLTFEYKTITV